MALRAIRTHFPRFMAILLIVALSAGFFAGLKITTEAMLATGEDYFEDTSFYDFRILSTLGFDKSTVEELERLEGIETVEGTYSADVLVSIEDKVSPYKLHAITEHTNLVTLEAGRMPTSASECLADVDRYTEEDIGKTFTVTEDNAKDTLSLLEEKEFTIVGLCNSPLYLGLDRGSTTIGSGAISTFIYVKPEAFKSENYGEYYTEINVTLSEKYGIYSDKYEELIDSHEEEITTLAEELVNERFLRILEEKKVKPELAEKFGYSAKVYNLTREENSGYVSFENDTAIIESVAYIFPVFFIAIAILVCVTTMSRMVDEERTQIGTLKAMGFSNGAIVGKYLIYAAIATIIGWAFGYFLCIWGLPEIFWIAYGEIYNFAPLTLVISLPLAALTLAISLVSILGTAYISCRTALREAPASLIRPRAGKAGKRVFLEYIKPLWNRLSFLRKITIRNMLLYKRRVVMMIVGISCCAGLLVTAFGIRDSMIDVGEIQFAEIQKYNIEASYDEAKKETVDKKLVDAEGLDRFLHIRSEKVEVGTENILTSVSLISYDTDAITEYWTFKNASGELTLPAKGEALISPKVQERFSLKPGDTIEVRDADMNAITLTVSDTYTNYLMDYIFISSETYTELFGEIREWKTNTIYVESTPDVAEDVSTKLTGIRGITSVNQLETLKNNVCEALDCLNYIIFLAVAFSAALAFIVIFNLTNINIAERRREIATVQVLGFYPKETESYVLKENLILAVVASLIGLPLGKLFHEAVMTMVRIDAIHFNNLVNPISYLLAFVGSVIFAVIVNAFMKGSIARVNMAESLKAVE